MGDSVQQVVANGNVTVAIPANLQNAPALTKLDTNHDGKITKEDMGSSLFNPNATRDYYATISSALVEAGVVSSKRAGLGLVPLFTATEELAKIVKMDDLTGANIKGVVQAAEAALIYLGGFADPINTDARNIRAANTTALHYNEKFFEKAVAETLKGVVSDLAVIREKVRPAFYSSEPKAFAPVQLYATTQKPRIAENPMLPAGNY